jgi:hypothetical protein
MYRRMAKPLTDRRSFIAGGLSTILLSGVPGSAVGACVQPQFDPATLGFRHCFSVSGGNSRKWTWMAKRHALQDEQYGLESRGCNWARMCRRTAGMSGYRAAVEINGLANAVPYLWEAGDVWRTPREFANGGGDCEDYAVAKYFLLRRAGWGDEQVGIFVYLPRFRPEVAHAVAVINDRKSVFSLDNLNKSITEINAKHIERPLFFVNESCYLGFI